MLMKRLIVLFLLFCLSRLGYSQQIEYSNREAPFVQNAISELDFAMLPPKGSLYLFSLDNKLKGSFTFDLTIRGKGEMATVFVVSNEAGTLKMQNMLKDRLKSFRFNFKIPKGKSYKFQYTLKFT